MYRKLKTYLTLSILLFCELFTLGQTYVIPDVAFKQYLITRIPEAFNSEEELIINVANSYNGDISCSELGINDISGIQHFHSITLLNCSFNNIASFPSLDSLTSLKQFWTYDNQLTTFPEINHLSELLTLNVKNNNLEIIPSLNGLNKLTQLDISGNQIKTISDLNSLTNLETFYGYNNLLDHLPEITNLTSLAILDIQGNKFTSIPNLDKNTNIEFLRISNNEITSLPNLSYAENLVEISFSNNKIDTFPDFSSNLNIENIDASNNSITSIPNIPYLTNLHLVNVSQNYLTFEDFNTYVSIPDFESIFMFAPQKKIVTNVDIDVTEGQKLVYNIEIDESNTNLKYTWFKEDQEIRITDNSFIDFESIKLQDIGNYSCVITSENILFSTLAIEVEGINLSVSPCIVLDSISYKLIDNTCSNGASITIIEKDFSENNSELSYQLTSTKNQQTFLSENNSIASITPGSYSLNIQDKNQCERSIENYIQIPNPTDCIYSFTPNNDGLEDTFFIDKTGKANIYNKDGKLIKSIDCPNHWDGKNNHGTYVPIGLYLIITGENNHIEVVVIN